MSNKIKGKLLIEGFSSIGELKKAKNISGKLFSVLDPCGSWVRFPSFENINLSDVEIVFNQLNKKCSCVGTTYSHVKPKDRTHKMNNWK